MACSLLRIYFCKKSSVSCWCEAESSIGRNDIEFMKLMNVRISPPVNVQSPRYAEPDVLLYF